MPYEVIDERTYFCPELAAKMLAAAEQAETDDLQEKRLLNAAWWGAMAGKLRSPKLH